MKQIVTQAIVLSRTHFGEADRIVTVITPDHGKVRLIAKGVRKIKSKLAGGIELFGVNSITFIEGKSEIKTLISSRLLQHFGQIVHDIERTMFAYSVLKIINRTTEDNAEIEYFNLTAETLASINNEKLSLDLIMLWFNMQLLKLRGQSPNLDTDSNGHKLLAEQNYNFDFESMSFRVYASGMYTAQHIKLLRLGLKLNSPAPLLKIRGIAKVLQNGRQLTDNMLIGQSLTNR